MNDTFRASETGTAFTCGDVLIGTAEAAQGTRDHFVPLFPGVFRWDRVADTPTDSMIMRFEANYKMQYQMLPAVMYDENKDPTIIDRNQVRRTINHESDEGAENCYFKYCFDEETKKPWRIDWWYTSVHGAAYSEGDAWSSALFLPPDPMDGAPSVYPDAHMYVDYTNSWYDVDAEAASAEKLMSDGCVIIGQHADSTGAPSAVEQAYQNGNDHVFSVGYNVSMLDVAPDVALTSATNNWSVCYTDLLKGAAEGNIPQDWSKGYNEGAVGITELGSCAAEGTADKVAEVEAAIKDGSLKVFDTSTFTVSADNVSVTADKSGAAVTTDDAGHVTSCKVDLSYYDYTSGSPELIYQGDTVDAIEDGAFVESTYRSAPYFTIRIDGITELS